MKLNVVMNEEVLEYDLQNKSRRSLLIRGGGHLVVGQELDTVDGGFNVYQTFKGEMADWVLLNESLSIEEMKDYVACLGLPSRVRPLLHFDNALSGWELKGPSLSYNLTKKDICSKRFVDSLVMFPHRMKKEHAAKWCHMVGGHLPVPQNQEENEELARLASGYINKCSNSWSTFAWLGLTRNLSREWETTINSSLEWNNFVLRGPTKTCLCPSITLSVNDGHWLCTPCDSRICVVCLYSNVSLFHLRGDCERTGFDRDLILKGVPQETPMYVGYFQSRMLFSEETWRLESTLEGSTSYAEMIDDTVTNPLGRHKWQINSTECGQYQVRSCVERERKCLPLIEHHPLQPPQTELVLSVCSPEQFPCDNGQCVPQGKRCDLRPDCSDETDEKLCNVVNLPVNYSPAVPPPPTAEDSLALLLSVEICSVREFELVGFKIALDLVIRIEWKDTRLEFFNLKDDILFNRVKNPAKIWLPMFFVESSSRSPAEELPSSPPLLQVRREHPPCRDEPSRATKVWKISTLLLTLFPLMLFYICTLMTDVSLQSCRYLFEILVKSFPSFSPKQVEIKFTNQFGYYVGNAILPSTFLVTICYLTFWFSLDDFQDRIMVSLTSLLVLTGLLTQTSQSMPKTAYLKLIDIWYITFIFIDFLIIVVLVVIEGLRQRFRYPEVKVTKGNALQQAQKPPVAWCPQTATCLARKVNTLSTVVFPIVCAIFMFIFFAIGSSNG
ncbi:uncharacterized protein LOC127004285 [Eriocheir sinensis]|uniref:uncharacterized protein LOC127004285 n=1 Tax=Eriocheir sinensis TaxID=95602 RepID=UPI0021C67A5A|nr:uncharacterized protein LOC127004285 [Eriocheir sinensis]